jgi:hypothetical protein
MADYHQALRNIEYAKQLKEQATTAYENRILDDQEYFQLAVERKKEQDAKIAEREAAEKAAALAEIDRLMSSPPTVEVMHRNEYTFLQEVILWSGKGYVLNENGFHSFVMGMYHVTMDAPAKKGNK